MADCPNNTHISRIIFDGSHQLPPLTTSIIKKADMKTPPINPCQTPSTNITHQNVHYFSVDFSPKTSVKPLMGLTPPSGTNNFDP
jgi:hypothetical protein